MNIWIFQTGEPLQIDEGQMRPMRAMNLTDQLLAQNCRVRVWSSSFFHQRKRHRSRAFETIELSSELHICLVPSRGYKKNISFKRFIDHKELGKNLQSELSNTTAEDMPDAVFIGFPPIEFAYVAAQFCVQHNIPYILDVKDMWPEYFLEKIPTPLHFIARQLLKKLFVMSQYTIDNANAFSTISQSYLRWLLRKGRRDVRPLDIIAPTTSAPDKIRHLEKHKHMACWGDFGLSLGEDSVIFYAGTINATLDINVISEAAMILEGECSRLKFVVCGDGPLKGELQRQCEGLSNVICTGWVSHDMLQVLAEDATASLVPYYNSPAMSTGIPNKFSDAMGWGIPVISCLTGDVQDMIVQHNVGQYYEEGNVRQLKDCCRSYYENEPILLQHKKNARKLYQEQFEFKKVYHNLANAIISLPVQSSD